MDPENAGVILELLREWHSGKLHPEHSGRCRTLILVSHSLDTAYHFASNFVMVRQGHIVGGSVLTRAQVPGGSQQILGMIESAARG